MTEANGIVGRYRRSFCKEAGLDKVFRETVISLVR
jgi:hypothetical protein